MMNTHALHLLQAGQTLGSTVRVGTMLRVCAGTVRVSEPPRWLAETLVHPARTLGEGELICIEAGGWVEITALGAAAQLQVIEAPPSGWRRLGYALGGCIPAIKAARRARLSLDHTSEAL